MWTSREIERQAGEVVVVHAVCVERQDGTWEARCPELDITRAAGTAEESVARLEEAVAVEVRRRGTGWEETLREVEVVELEVGRAGEDGETS